MSANRETYTHVSQSFKQAERRKMALKAQAETIKNNLKLSKNERNRLLTVLYNDVQE